MEAADERRPQPALKFNFGRFETPLTIKQVETHLIFGPLSRRFSIAWLVLGLFGTGSILFYARDEAEHARAR